jgi:hypothetical protein
MRLLVAAVVLLGGAAHAADAVSYVKEPAWVAPIYSFAEKALRKHPSTFPASAERKEALMVLDGPLHLDAANRFRSTHRLYLRQAEKAIAEIEQTTVTSGARVWKIYNHGFVVRTPDMTVGMDLVRGWNAGGQFYGMPPDLVRRLVAQLDLLTVSHVHGDHFDAEVTSSAIESGVPVLAGTGVIDLVATSPLNTRAVRHDGDTTPTFQRAGRRRREERRVHCLSRAPGAGRAERGVPAQNAWRVYGHADRRPVAAGGFPVDRPGGRCA